MAQSFKFKVDVWEYERGWGAKIDSTKEFDQCQEQRKDWYRYKDAIAN